MKSKTQSQLTQSFEKIALEKGLIKQESFKKVAEVASKISTVKPTLNLIENIVKLCNALRAKGFNKYANDIENKLMQYKKAETALYDVSKETGEDLIDSAHPKGSHKLEGVEGDATIETILDRQKKMRAAVGKMPTGKLAAKDALNIVKILLAQNYQKDLGDVNNKVVTAYNKINGALNTILKIASTSLNFDPMTPSAHPWLATLLDVIPGGQIPGVLLQFFSKYSDSIKTKQQDLTNDYNDYNKEPSYEHLQDILSKAGEIKDLINKMPNNAPAITKSVMDNIDSGIADLNDALTKWNTMGSTPTNSMSAQPQAQQTEQQQIDNRIKILVDKVNASTSLTKDQKTKVFNWLNGITAHLSDPKTIDNGKRELLDAEKALANY